MDARNSEARCERCGNAVAANEAVCAHCLPTDAARRGPTDDLRLTPAQLAAVPHLPTVEESAVSWGRPSTAPAGERQPNTGPKPQDVAARPSSPPPAPNEPERRPSVPPPPMERAEHAKSVKSEARASVPPPASESERRPSTPPAANEPERRPSTPPAAPKPESLNPEDTLDDEPPETTDVSLRPPVLASQALLQALLPPEPGRRSMRLVAALLGMLGACLTVRLLGWSSAGAPVLVGYLALATLGALPMAYVARAATLLTLSAVCLGAVCLLLLDAQLGSTRRVALLGVVLLLGTGLHFRAWHRASIAARALVAAGIITGGAWLSAMSGINELGVLDGDIRTWAPRLLELPLGLLLTLALLAFMDGRTTGGCSAWATLLWLWHGAVVLAEHVAHAPANQPWLATLTAQPVLTMLNLATILLAPIVGLSTAQLLAAAFARRR